MYNLFSPLIKIYKTLYLFAYDIAGNYGLALILLSFFTFVVLYPFNKKAQGIQSKEHKIQVVLAPQVDLIKKHFSGREQYDQLQWLYKRYGYHPLYAIRSALGFILQIPFLTAAYYMLSELAEIQGVSWGIIPDLSSPDHLLDGINILPFIMTLVTVIYAFVIPEISRKERLQTFGIGIFFLLLLYSAPSALLIFWTCNLIWSLLDCVLGKNLQWLGDFVSENELAFHIIFALSVTVGLLVPSEIYIKNASQLWFNFKDILKYLLTDTAKYYSALLIIYVICRHKSIKCTYLSILFGLLLGVFLQSYVIGLDYGTFDGHEIKWEKYTTLGIANTVIWLVCIIEPFIIFRRFKFDREKIIKIVKPVTFCVVLIQCTVLLFTLVKKPTYKDISYEDGRAGILTTKNMFTVSSKENIIVFLLDAYDAAIFEEIQEKNPEVIEELKDFTYYPDTTSSYCLTHYSLPEILTGKLFDPRNRWAEYLSKAWKDISYFNKLKKENYEINLYTDGNFVDKNAPISNLVTEKVTMNKENADKFKEVAVFRLAPHCLKKYCYKYYADNSYIMVLNSNIKKYVSDDRGFFIRLKEGLHVINDKNVFHFYHLGGMHPPYTFDENVELIPVPDYSHKAEYAQGLGNLKIVKEYISKLKELELYNNATICILADHGHHNSVGRRPLFLIKQPNENHKILNEMYSINHVSNLMSLVFLRFNDSMIKEAEILEKPVDSIRAFYAENDSDGLFIKYIVNSPAKDIKSWVKLGPVKKNFVSDKTYVIGQKIDFSYFGDSYKYKENGWADQENSFASMINQREATLVFDLDSASFKTDRNLIVRIVGDPLLHYYSNSSNHLPYRDMRLVANNNLVGKWRFSEEEKIDVKCKIPNNIIESKLVLQFLIDNPVDVSEPERFQINEMQIIYEKE